MKKTKIHPIWALLLIIPVVSCTSTVSEPSVPSVDEIIRRAAMETVRFVPEGSSRTLAVYSLTTNGEQTLLGDYITQGLTTEIANLESPGVRIVSRQAVDRIVEEYKYQLSELVDRDTQVRLGRQIGADLILTGFITPGKAGARLNLQLIEIETALVLGGFIDDFLPPDGMIPPARGESSVVSGKREYPESYGSSTVTTIFDDFSGGISSLALSHFEEHYGDRVREAYGKVLVEADEDGNGYALYTFEGEIEHADLSYGWDDSDAYFYFDIDLGEDVAGYDGVSFGILPSGFTKATVMLKPATSDDYLLFTVHMSLVPDRWQEVKLPFSVFVPDTPGSVLSGPVVLEISLGMWENVQLGHFSPETGLEGSVAVDDVGFYEMTSADTPGLIESFDDEITRLPMYGELYGFRFYYDYSESDDGVFTENTGVESVSLSMERGTGGPKGGHLAVRSIVAFGGDMPQSYEDASNYITVRGNFDIDWTGFNALGFMARSNILENGYLEIYDIDNDQYYSADVSITESWGRQVISFDRLRSERSTLFKYPSKPGRTVLYFTFDVPRRAVVRGIDEGSLEIELDLDEIFLIGD